MWNLPFSPLKSSRYLFSTISSRLVINSAFPGSSDGKVSACNAGDLGSIPGLGRSLSWKDPLEKDLETHSNWSGKNWQPTPVGVATHSNTLAWKILWTESLAGYSQWGHKESDTTKQLTHSLTLPHL